jgi:hypothetical protein
LGEAEPFGDQLLDRLIRFFRIVHEQCDGCELADTEARRDDRSYGKGANHQIRFPGGSRQPKRRARLEAGSARGPVGFADHLPQPLRVGGIGTTKLPMNDAEAIAKIEQALRFGIGVDQVPAPGEKEHAMIEAVEHQRAAPRDRELVP